MYAYGILVVVTIMLFADYLAFKKPLNAKMEAVIYVQTGFSKVESVFISITFGAIFLVGAYAVSLMSITLAVVSLIIVLFLWYYLHRIRICNFCDQSCPYRPKAKIARYKQLGFTKIEGITFYPTFLLILSLYIVAIYKLNIFAGLIITVLNFYGGVLYRRKICVNCKIPCPINPHKDRTNP